MGSDTQAKFSHTTYISLDDPINPTGVYGQISSIATSNAELPGVYGHISAMTTANVELIGVYGQISAISGVSIEILNPTIQGLGDVIYYGEEADININTGIFTGSFNNQVAISGIATATGVFDNLSSSQSNSIVFSQNGTATLPEAEDGLYLFFSNHNGLSLTVSGVNPIVTSVGEANEFDVSGVGSHLGIIAHRSKWIAIEESGIA